MKILLPISNDLHRRNWLHSGMVDLLERRGHRVDVVGDPVWLVGGRNHRTVREGLRLASLVAREHESATYAHKLTLRRPRLARIWLAFWRFARSMGIHPEQFAASIEARLRDGPLRDGLYDVAVIPTLIHEDDALNGVMKACRAAKVPILAVPASWDTLSSKGGFLVRPDKIAVWGEASRHHALLYHGFWPSQVTITGPPHFFPYVRPPIPLRSPGYALYAGTSITYHEDEAALVQQLEAAFRGRIMYRPHPRRIAVAGVALDRGPEPTRAQLDGAAVLVTAFSTMLVEAALCGRPSLVVGFGRSTQGTGGLLRHADYAHMLDVIQQPGVTLCPDLGDMVSRLSLMLGTSGSSVNPDLRQWATRIAAVDRDPRLAIAEWIEASA